MNYLYDDQAAQRDAHKKPMNREHQSKGSQIITALIRSAEKVNDTAKVLELVKAHRSLRSMTLEWKKTRTPYQYAGAWRSQEINGVIFKIMKLNKYQELYIVRAEIKGIAFLYGDGPRNSIRNSIGGAKRLAQAIFDRLEGMGL